MQNETVQKDNNCVISNISTEQLLFINGVKVRIRFLQKPNTEFPQVLKKLLITAYMQNSSPPLVLGRGEYVDG